MSEWLMATNWTTFRTGSDPEELHRFSSAAEYLEALGSLGNHRVVGGGSNLLVSDDGPAGTIAVLSSALPIILDIDDGRVTLDAAGNWSRTVVELGRQGLAGVESLIGIPGTVGGAAVQNIGAYGTEISELIESVRVLEVATGEMAQIGVEDCGYSYRDSRFKTAEQGDWVIVSVTLRLVPGGRHVPRYAELARQLEQRFASTGGDFSIEEVNETVLMLRQGKNMVWDEADQGTWGAGSFFVNPIVDTPTFEAVQDAASGEVPAWPTGRDGEVKLAAGWLVENAGYKRGHRWERVGLANGHALGLVNASGHATTADVIAAASEVASAVTDRFAIRLHAEPIFMGFDRSFDLPFDVCLLP